MGNVGGGEILVILLVALVVLGPEQLPDVVRQLGKGLAEIRKIRNGIEREINNALMPTLDPTPTPPAAPDDPDTS